ncbi:hypothetical protein IK110_03330 [Candidatus Saccharibacteria bacterium]|nr:hypothetical protein [Candidatus Saccharibacteria bacterium]
MGRFAYPHYFKIEFFETKDSAKPIQEKKFSVLALNDKGARTGAENFGNKTIDSNGWARFKVTAIDSI